MRWLTVPVWLAIASGMSVLTGWTADFSVQLSTAPGVRTLVSAGSPWRYYKGTAEPPVDWARANDVFLGASWGTGNSAFGYGYPNLATTFGDMRNNYSTLYIRQTFNVDEVFSARRLRFQVDYDDGFVAYLDGKEVARVNAAGIPGQRLGHQSLATASHVSPGAPEMHRSGLDVPAIFVNEEDGPRLRHVFAIQGLNRALADENFLLNANLLVEDLFALTAGDTIQLSGKAAAPAIARVDVNGTPAARDAVAGTWAHTYALKPGMNRIVVQAWDQANNVVRAETNDVVSTRSLTEVNGPITQTTTWTPAMGVIKVAGYVEVRSGAALTIAAGTTVLFAPAASLMAVGGAVHIAGAAGAPVFLLPADARSSWKGIAGSGVGSLVTLRFAEMAGASIRGTNSVTVLVEDSILRDFSYDEDQIERYLIYGFAYCDFTLKRSQFLGYYTSAFGGECMVRVEDCVFIDAEHDFIKPQETPRGSYIRRCLFQRSTVPGSDAIDTAVNAQLIVADSIFRDIPDKAISLEGSDLIISNCLIYRAGTGVAVKDDSTAVLLHNTITESAYGIGVFLKNPGAQFATAFATNNIVWNNGTNITLRNPETGAGPSGSLTIVASDIGRVGTSSVYPGTGNFNKDPLFQDPTIGDFRLRTGSPVIGAGLGGRDMGPAFPLGPIIPDVVIEVPIRLSYSRPANGQFELQLNGNPNAIFVLEASGDLAHWTLVLSNAAPNGILNFRDTIGDNQKFYRFQVRR